MISCCCRPCDRRSSQKLQHLISMWLAYNCCATPDGRPQPGSSPVVRDMSVSLQPGTRTLLIGANGAGKTTLLKASLLCWSIGWQGDERVVRKDWLTVHAMLCDQQTHGGTGSEPVRYYQAYDRIPHVARRFWRASTWCRRAPCACWGSRPSTRRPSRPAASCPTSAAPGSAISPLPATPYPCRCAVDAAYPGPLQGCQILAQWRALSIPSQLGVALHGAASQRVP